MQGNRVVMCLFSKMCNILCLFGECKLKFQEVFLVQLNLVDAICDIQM